MNKKKLYKHYVFAGMVIGVLQILDGLSFVLGWNSDINTAYSWLELLWFLFSIVVFILLLRDKLPFCAPLIYISYILCNVAMATLVFEPTITPPGYSIPTWFTMITITSALYFIASCSRLYRNHLQDQ